MWMAGWSKAGIVQSALSGTMPELFSHPWSSNNINLAAGCGGVYQFAESSQANHFTRCDGQPFRSPFQLLNVHECEDVFCGVILADYGICISMAWESNPKRP